MSESIFKLVVEKAHARLAQRANWTRFATARTHNDRMCDPFDPAAVRFCCYGSLLRAAHDLVGCKKTAILIAQRTARRLTGCASELEAIAELNALNDGPPNSARAGLLRLFDLALAEC